MTNAEQLNELANNAELNHWPLHLGLTTDAEKVEYLARQLREAAAMVITNDELLDEVKDLHTKIDDLESDFESRIESLRNDLEKLEKEAEEE